MSRSFTDSNELYHAEEEDIVLPRRHIFDVWESTADKDHSW